MARTTLQTARNTTSSIAKGRRNVRRGLLVAIPLLALSGSAAFAQSAITLTVDRGPGAGEVTLTWTEVQGPYSVFGSNAADDVTDPANRLGQTSTTSWIDASVAQPVLFYRVQSGCDPLIDADDDGSSQCDDCADGNGSMFPGAAERCNGLDDDCDLLIDEDFDADGDGFSPCPGDVELFDCDDGHPNVNPGVIEDCGALGSGNGVDDDCDGYIDETCQPCDAVDSDADGVSGCEGDCAPDDGNVFPGADEACDGLDTDCNVATVENCDAGEPCNFPGDADVCRPDLPCNCLLDAAGSCSGAYACSGLCNYSETGSVGDGCAADQTCLFDLLHSANVHGCAENEAMLGMLQGGVPCPSNEACRSGVCDRVCVGPGCSQSYCQDFCASDTYCPASDTVCRLARSGSNIDGRCWPTPGPFLGGGAVGDACVGDSDCDHGFCTNDGGSLVCTAACCGDSDCPFGSTCSLRGDAANTGIVYAPPGTSTCNTDPDCPTGMICFQNECVWQLSETAPMCLPDVAGQSNLPAGSACTLNADCRSNFCEAGSGICIETCCTDSDCGTGQICRLQYVQTTFDRATQARVCVTSPTDQVLRHD